MAGVHLHGSVLRCRDVRVAVRPVVGDPVLQRAEHRAWAWRGRQVGQLGVELEHPSSRAPWSRSPSRRAAGAPPGSARRDLRVDPLGVSRRHSASDGCGSQRWTSRCPASASSTRRWPSGSAVAPKTESRSGRATVDGSSRRRATASSSRSAGDGSPTASRTSRHSRGCHRRSSGRSVPRPSSSRPSAQARTICGRCTSYAPNSRATRCASRNRRPRRTSSPSSPRYRLTVRSQPAPWCASIAASTCHASRSAPTGPRRRSSPAPRSPGGAATGTARSRRCRPHPRWCPAGGRAAARPNAPRHGWAPRRRPA